jgi:hypothetical protein
MMSEKGNGNEAENFDGSAQRDRLVPHAIV